jgi:UDP-N-acetylmuramoyl-tripeptide--D-alanyl-D-alanine ligase
LIRLTLADVAEITGGRLHGANPDTPVTGLVEFDSRRVARGGLFLAFPGEHADGHDFVGQAIASGAVAAIVTRPVDAPSIEVADGFSALAALASAVVRRLTGVTVVAVTGSTGKTSTKDLLAQLLERLGPTIAPPESFNNELGHPYTVLLSTVDTRFLVLETSARGIGHIRYLTDIAPPRIGVVLNVGSAHVGVFGSQDAIAQAKGELVEALPAAADGGVAVLNADDPLVAAMAARTKARIVTFGESAGAGVRATDVRLGDLGRAVFRLHTGSESAQVSLRVIGRHQVGNALAAAAVALECGMPLDAAAEALSDATARSSRRMEPRERNGVLILNDAYNANPESMRAALETLVWIGRDRLARTWAVLGPMAELGETATAEHEAVGRLAAQLSVGRLVAVGEQARSIVQGAAGLDATSVPDTDAAITLLRAQVRPGDVVLVKASRSASLERVAVALGDEMAPDVAQARP